MVQIMQRLLPRFSLHSKLLAGFAVLLGILFVASLLVRIRLLAVHGEITTVLNDRRPVAVLSTQLESQLDDAIAMLGLYLSLREPVYADDFRYKMVSVVGDSEGLQHLPMMAANLRDSELLKGVRADLGKLSQLGEQVIQLSSSDEATFPGLAYANEHVNPINLEILQLLSRMLQEEENVDDDRGLQKRISDLRYYWVNVVSDVRTYLAYRSERVLHDMQRHFDAMRKGVNDLALGDDGREPDRKNSLQQLGDALNQFEVHWKKLQTIHSSEAWRSDSHLMHTRIAPLFQSIRSRLSLFTQEQNAATDAVAGRLLDHSRNITHLVTLFLILGVFVSIGMAWGISHIVVMPIRQAASAMESIASGDADLTKRLAIEGNDEVALLAGSFNTFADKARQSAEEERALSKLLRLSLKPTDMVVYLEQALALMTGTVTWLGLLPNGGIFLAGNGCQPELRLAAVHNFAPELLGLCATVPFGRCLCGRAAASGKIEFACCVDDRHDIRFANMQPHGHYSVPIMSGSSVMGVLVLYLPHGHAHSVSEERFLNRVAEVISMGISLRQAHADLLSAKQRAELAKDQLTGITANIPGIIFQCRGDAHGDWIFPYVSSGTAALLGATMDDAEHDIQRLFRDVHPQDKARLEQAMHRSSDRWEPINLEYRIVQEDRGTRWVLCSASPRNHADGGILWDGLLLDITDRKSLESQLLQAQKLESVGQLAAGIAHEINTPTQYVRDNTRFLQDAFQEYQSALNASQRLRERLPQSADYRDLAAEVDRVLEEGDIAYLSEEIPHAIAQSLEGLQRIATIVAAMKEFTYPGTDAKQPVDINAVVRNIVTVSRNEWKYVADLETELDETLPSPPGYRDKLGQVILNLIVNASHAIGDAVTARKLDKGCIVVRTAKVDGAVEIRVVDNGQGVPESIQQKIFDPFFTTKALGKGTGQGLSIARSVIVDLHQGTLTLESTPGEGATFLIRLPLQQDKGTDAIAA